MNSLHNLPISAHHKQLLQTGNEKYAWAIIKDVFDSFGPDGPRECAWFTLVTALGSASEEVEAQHRSTMIFFYECAAALYSAVYALHTGQPGLKKGGKHKKRKGRA